VADVSPYVDGGLRDAAEGEGEGAEGEGEGAEGEGECLPVPGDRLTNGEFEDWSDSLPTGWYGEESNADWVEAGSPAHCGRTSCRLVNEGERHQRFTVPVSDLPAGRYTCRYFVRGEGEIRNAFYDGSRFSSYQPEGYHFIATDDWREITYNFNLAADVSEGFELIFSFHNTVLESGSLLLDTVSLVRQPGPCDEVACPEWSACRVADGLCHPLPGRCDDEDDCPEQRRCDATHTCVLEEGRCESQADCDLASPTPRCDLPSKTCVAGDPCADVVCLEWQQCAPATATCQLAAGRCRTTADCTGSLPACKGETHTCVGIDDPVNLVANGGFERWSNRPIPYQGEPYVPEGWMGYGGFGENEIRADALARVTDEPHGGEAALQIDQPEVAKRFTSEYFDVPVGSYTCAYWARGHGGIRHYYYSSGGWSPETFRVDLNQRDWQRFTFTIPGNVREMRLIFYASFTQADLGHIALDDVVCTRDAPR
jgi:hypothetical protein